MYNRILNHIFRNYSGEENFPSYKFHAAYRKVCQLLRMFRDLQTYITDTSETIA